MPEQRYADLDDFEEALRGRLDRRHAYESVRNLAALYDALMCHLIRDEEGRGEAELAPDDPVPLAEWVVAGLNREVGAALSGEETHTRAAIEAVWHEFKAQIPMAARGRGRNARWGRQFTADHVHFARFYEVWFWHLKDPGWYSPGAKRTYGWNVLRNGASRVGHDDSIDAFERAAERLKLGAAIYRAAPGTIRNSYETVTQAIDKGEIGRFYPSKFVEIPGATLSAMADLTF